MAYESQIDILQYYRDRVSDFEELLVLNKKGSSKYSLTRLAIVIFAIPIIYFLTKIGAIAIALGLIICIVLFVFAVLKQQAFDQKVKECERLIAINGNEIDSIEKFENTYYDGVEFEQAHHLYSDDLDIFGPNSLFGLINRASTFNGVRRLAHYFTSIPVLSELNQRQEAIKELEQKPEWCQEFASSLYEMTDGHKRDLAREIDDELDVDLSFATGNLLLMYQRIVPFLWIGIVVLYFVRIDIANTLASILFVVNLLLVMRNASEVGVIQTHLAQASTMLRSYANAMRTILKEDWKANLIYDKVEALRGQNNSKNTIEMLTSLSKIIEHLDYRLNLIPAIVLNGLVLWDYRVLSRLAKWTRDNDSKLLELFEFVGEIEALSSLATWSHNYPNNNYAICSETYFELHAKAARHPLIPTEENVANDFNIEKGTHLSIITGSNMSGKSTLLRTLGINTILAYSGAKVAADSFEVSIVQVISYMRIKDILEESVSTFKAELNRINLILQMLKDGNKCFILIDEMLRGTNSKDKLVGSIGIAKRLIAEKTYAMVATHDIKLAELGTEIKSEIANYYFDIDYADGELVFDYKVKQGICENFNATFLLEQLGIDMSAKEQ